MRMYVSILSCMHTCEGSYFTGQTFFSFLLFIYLSIRFFVAVLGTKSRASCTQVKFYISELGLIF